MDLIERYVAAVGHRLPEKIRKDVESELESLIMDELEAKAKQGRSYTQEDVIAVLKELGSPQEVALRYAPSPRYIIGPQLYDTYFLVLGIALGAVALGVSINFAIDLSAQSMSYGQHLGKVFTSIISGAPSAVGSVTIVFAILDRTLPDKEKRALLDAHGKWDPRQLPAVQKPVDRVKVSDSVAVICFTVLALLFFNLFAEEAKNISRNGWHLLALLNTEALSLYLPYWNVLWAATIIEHVLLLASRERTAGVRFLSIAISVLNIAMLAFMLNGPSLLDSRGILAFEGAVSIDGIGSLADLLQKLYRGSLIVGVVATTVETLVKIYHLIRASFQKSIGIS